MNEMYIKRCQRRLNDWNAPLEDWYCVNVIDMEHDGNQCELCDCKRVRFIHVMEHERYFEPLYVGCICAGIMEGDILAAKERDNKMKNRAKRRRNFPNRKWKKTRHGGYCLTYKGKSVYINRSRYNKNHFGVSYKGASVWRYKDKPIDDFLSATYAAFDLVDPVSAVLEI